MALRTVETKFYEFDQNNSGGRFVIDDDRGLGPSVWIEATSVDDATARAERIGIYFDGCADGVDCECCGDRWSTPWRDGPIEMPKDLFARGRHDTVYVHAFDGSIERIRVDVKVCCPHQQN